MKKLITLFIACLMLCLCFSSCKETVKDGMPTDDNGPIVSDNFVFEKTTEITDFVLITMQSGKKIVIQLEPETAPITVQNFKNLVSEKFYDGLIFHRVIKDFMIQGGGYKPDFSETDTPSIKGEFAANGIKNDLKHERGVISMARATAYDSASSQFFICRKTSPHLDGDYAAFGRVVYGMDTVDEIAEVKVNSSYKPITEQKMASVSFCTAVTK